MAALWWRRLRCWSQAIATRCGIRELSAFEPSGLRRPVVGCGRCAPTWAHPMPLYGGRFRPRSRVVLRAAEQDALQLQPWLSGCAWPALNAVPLSAQRGEPAGATAGCRLTARTRERDCAGVERLPVQAQCLRRSSSMSPLPKRPPPLQRSRSRRHVVRPCDSMLALDRARPSGLRCCRSGDGGKAGAPTGPVAAVRSAPH